MTETPTVSYRVTLPPGYRPPEWVRERMRHVVLLRWWDRYRTLMVATTPKRP